MRRPVCLSLGAIDRALRKYHSGHAGAVRFYFIQGIHISAASAGIVIRANKFKIGCVSMENDGDNVIRISVRKGTKITYAI